MMHTLRNFSLLCFLLLLTGCSTVLSISTAPNINHSNKDLGVCAAAAETKPVLIHTVATLGFKASYGSGIWIHTHKGNNYFVTNAHVVIDPEHIGDKIFTTTAKDSKEYLLGTTFLYNESGNKVKTEVIALSYDTFSLVGSPKYHKRSFKDVAILKATELPESFTKDLSQHKITMRNPSDVTYVSGFKPTPEGFSKEINCKPTLNGRNAIFMVDPSEMVIKGQSGSALLNENMEIVGLLAARGEIDETGKKLHIAGMDDKGRMLMKTGKAKDVNYKIYGIGTHAVWIAELLNKLP